MNRTRMDATTQWSSFELFLPEMAGISNSQCHISEGRRPRKSSEELNDVSSLFHNLTLNMAPFAAEVVMLKTLA